MILTRSFMGLSIVAVLLGVVSSVGAASGDTAKYQIFLVSPPINNRAIRPEEPLPEETCQPGDQLQVMACRGEYEPASFVVETKEALKAVSVDVAPLRGSAGAIPANSIDIRVVLPTFRRVTDFPAALNWLLIHDPNLLVLKDEPWPLTDNPSTDIRNYTKTHHFTREPVDSATLQPADIEHRQQFWITVHVPEDAAVGKYTTTLTITAANASPREIGFELTVPPFDLAPPRFEYSVYYPAYLEGGPGGATVLTQQQYLAELRNMVEHGCLNPNIYAGPGIVQEDGQLDMSHLERVLTLRKQAGITAKTLYLIGNGPIVTNTKLAEDKRAQNIESVEQVVRWARERGYDEVYFMGKDEATGDVLIQQREVWEMLHLGGAKVFAANYGGFYGTMDDLLDLPVLEHPMGSRLDKTFHTPSSVEAYLGLSNEIRDAIDLKHILAPKYREMIAGVHSQGFKIYTYMDPMGGHVIPETHRRMRGLGLWKSGVDGTMTWSYTHIVGNNFVESGPAYWFGIFDFVLRGKEAPFDTLAWEAYREGYDDARYLATLNNALKQAEKSDNQLDLVKETRAWLENISVDADLDIWRHEMAQRIEQLSENLR